MKGALKRGDWYKTKEILLKGSDWIISKFCKKKIHTIFTIQIHRITHRVQILENAMFIKSDIGVLKVVLKSLKVPFILICP